MKLLGIDYGLKKIGLAYTEGDLPSPLAVIYISSKKQVLTEIVNICERLEIEQLVIGLSGGNLDKKAKQFGENLSMQTKLPVDYADETLTSVNAIAKMVHAKTTRKKRQTMEDAVAATIILNTYLESQKSNKDIPL